MAKKRQRAAVGSDDLTPKEARFVDLYIVSLNGSAAYTEAFGTQGASAKVNASRLLGTEKIQDAVLAAIQERSARTAVDQDYVINGARDLFERCMQKAAVAAKKGDPRGVHRWTFNAAGAAQALALLAKHVGLGERPNVNINIDFDSLTDEQLEHLANGGSLASLPR